MGEHTHCMADTLLVLTGITRWKDTPASPSTHHHPWQIEDAKKTLLQCRKVEMCLIINLPKQAGFSHNHVTFMRQYYKHVDLT